MGKTKSSIAAASTASSFISFDESSAKTVMLECDSNDINECADDFIKKFRHNLEIQRVESILENENEHMLTATKSKK